MEMMIVGTTVMSPQHVNIFSVQRVMRGVLGGLSVFLMAHSVMELKIVKMDRMKTEQFANLCYISQAQKPVIRISSSVPTKSVLIRTWSVTLKMTAETSRMKPIVPGTSVQKTLHVTISASIGTVDLSVSVMKDTDQVKTTSTSAKTLMSVRTADHVHRCVLTPLGHTNVPAILAMFSRLIFKAARQTAPFLPG